jgi:hypothetical protein
MLRVSRLAPNGICDVQARCEAAADSNVPRCYAVPIGKHLQTFRGHSDILEHLQLVTKRRGLTFHKFSFMFGEHNLCKVCRGEGLLCVRHSAADRPKHGAEIYRIYCLLIRPVCLTVKNLYQVT